REAVEKGVYPESRRAATSAGGRGAGGQDRPTGCGRHPQLDLRGRLSGLLVWLPTGTQPASSAGRALVRDLAEACELHTGCGHSGIFRFDLPRVDAPVRAASRGRPPDSPADPEMAESRSAGGRRMVGDGNGYAAGGGDFTPAGQYLFALRFRPLGERVAQETRAGRR